MSAPSRQTSRPWEPQRSRQEAQRPETTWPAGDWVFCLWETMSQREVRRCEAPYEAETRGAPPFAPAMMGCRWR
jgi:hypothetical protein